MLDTVLEDENSFVKMINSSLILLEVIFYGGRQAINI